MIRPIRIPTTEDIEREKNSNQIYLVLTDPFYDGLTDDQKEIYVKGAAFGHEAATLKD